MGFLCRRGRAGQGWGSRVQHRQPPRWCRRVAKEPVPTSAEKYLPVPHRELQSNNIPSAQHPPLPSPSPTQLPSLTLSVIFPLCRRESKCRRREINNNCCVKKRDVIRMRRGS